MSTISIHRHFSLRAHNTFGLDARAEYFVEIASPEALSEALGLDIRPVLILGGGSNLLLTNDIAGLVIYNSIPGIEVEKMDEDHVWVKVGGGVSWHAFVLHAVAQNWGGVENLSLIPGTVGAAPVQNIGAYGVELKDVFDRLEAIELESGALRVFTAADCAFGYRDSFFKRAGKDRFCITSVTLRLTRRNHRLNTAYGDIRKVLAQWNIDQPGISDISRAVIEIRSSKLPDPAKIGNCGSFFKNPLVDRSILEKIQSRYPNAPFYEQADTGQVKIPAGWLIEQCGWKGKRLGNAGCYEKQALVLVNLGGATGGEACQLARAIIYAVQRIFGIRLEPEVNVL